MKASTSYIAIDSLSAIYICGWLVKAYRGCKRSVFASCQMHCSGPKSQFCDEKKRVYIEEETQMKKTTVE
jgi:hypothetical protein